MLIRKCPRNVIQTAAHVVGVQAAISQRGAAWLVKLCPGKAKQYRRRRETGLYHVRTSCIPHIVWQGSLCWHGFKAFFDAVYARCPDASIRTALAKYRGAESYLIQWEATGERLTGYGPFRMEVSWKEACDCDILSQPLVCEVCGTTDGVSYKRHDWTQTDFFCKDRHCRRAIEARNRLRGEP